jgi:hypothetical protein
MRFGLQNELLVYNLAAPDGNYQKAGSQILAEQG